MARKLEVEIVGDASSLHRALGKADSSAGGFGKTLGKMGKIAAFSAGGAGLGALAVGLKIGIGEYQQSEKVAAQTNAVIKSTGGVANVTAKHVSDLATSIMKKTGIDDEQIASSENMLLTFKEIHNQTGKNNDIFDQATSIVTDMSVAFGTDASKSAIQLGKALNDPIKGVSALAKIGVTFTQGQKDQIKALVDSGQTMKAQKIILKELRSEVGGSAEAIGKTLPGQINIAKETFRNFAGELVAKMIPALEQTIGVLRDKWPETSKAVKKAWMEDIKPSLDSFIVIVKQVSTTVKQNWSTIGPIVMAVAKSIEAAIKLATAPMRTIAALLRGDWSAAWRVWTNLVRTQLEAVKAMVGAAAVALFRLGRAMGEAVKRGVVAGLEAIGGAVWNQLQNIGGAISRNLGNVASWGARVGAHLVSGIISGLASLPGRLVAAIKSAVNAVIDRINSALTFHFTIPIPFHKDATIGHTSNIPHLASGGIVTGPTLAMIGERGPEAVIPLGGAGRDLNATIVVQVDGETLWRTTQKYALRDLARGGAGLSPA
jgi:hypothetical protein